MNEDETPDQKNKRVADSTYAGTGTDGEVGSTPRDTNTENKPGLWEQIKDDLFGGDGESGGWDFGGGNGGGGDGGGGD